MTAEPASCRARVDLVVLDIAGTTVDERGAVYVALAAAMREGGFEPTQEQLTGWMGADKREAITAALTLRHGREPIAGKVDAVYADFRVRLGAAYEAVPPTPLPGVLEAFTQFRSRDIKVALSTGFSRDITVELMDGLGWRQGVVDTVVCAEDVGAGRPKPYMIFEAMRRLGIADVSRVLVAGDTVRDLQAGCHAGAGLVVGVLTGAQDAATLGRTRHTHLVPGVADIPALVGA